MFHYNYLQGQIRTGTEVLQIVWFSKVKPKKVTASENLIKLSNAVHKIML